MAHGVSPGHPSDMRRLASARTTFVAMNATTGIFFPDERGVYAVKPRDSPRRVSNMPVPVVAAVRALTPGRTTNGIPRAARASVSSASLPKSPASPPFKRTTRLPLRASSQMHRVISSWHMEWAPQRLPTNMNSGTLEYGGNP